MYFNKIDCFLAKNGALRSGSRLTEQQIRQIRTVIDELDLQPPLHFQVALLPRNRGIYARLFMIRRLRQYDVIERGNMLFLINVNQEIQE